MIFTVLQITEGRKQNFKLISHLRERSFGDGGRFHVSGRQRRARPIGMRRLSIVTSLFVGRSVPSSSPDEGRAATRPWRSRAAMKVSCESIFDPAVQRFITAGFIPGVSALRRQTHRNT